ncbi:MAG: hypothetical protein QG553_95 [Patescibacteria group bacterium]|nr:hypothetical protein [Patescibacteria group bacterium]
MATPKKSTKKPASKATSRSVKSSKPKILQMLVGLMLVLALVFLGTFVYTKWKDKEVKAKAASSALIYNSGGYRIYVCRLSYPPASGYELSVFAHKPQNTPLVELVSASTFDQSAKYINDAKSNKQWREKGTFANNNLRVPNNGWYRVAIRYNGKIIHQTALVSINFTPTCN